MPRFRNASFGLRLAKLTIGAEGHAEEPKKYLVLGSLARCDRCMLFSGGPALGQRKACQDSTLRQRSAAALVNSPQSKLRHRIHNRRRKIAADVCLCAFIQPSQTKDCTGIDD